MLNSKIFKKNVEWFFLVVLFIIFVFYFFHSRKQIANLTSFYQSNALKDKAGFFASIRSDNVISERIDSIESFYGSKNKNLITGDTNKTVWRSVFYADTTRLYNFKAFSKGSMLVYVDGLLRLNLYDEGSFNQVDKTLILKKGYHTVRIIYRNSNKLYDPVIGFMIEEFGLTNKIPEFIPVDIKGNYGTEFYLENITGHERNMHKIFIFLFAFVLYCKIFRRYFNYGTEFVFVFTFSLGYIFPSLYFLSSDESKTMVEVLSAGCFDIYADYVKHSHMLFYHYVDYAASFFGYRIEGIRFATALISGVTAIFTLKVFKLLFVVEKQNFLFYMQSVLWFSFLPVVILMRFLSSGTTNNPLIFMFVVYICLKAKLLLSKGYMFVFLMIGGVLFGLATIDNISDISFFLSVVISILIIRQITLKKFMPFIGGFIGFMLFHYDWLIAEVFSGNIFAGKAEEPFLCKCFSWEFLFKNTDSFYLLHIGFFFLVFISLLILRYFVKRQHCFAIGFCFILSFCLILFKVLFTDFHIDLNYLYISLIIMLFVLSSTLYELIDSGKKGFVFVAYTLFSVMLIFNACALYKFFKVENEDKQLAKALICSETPFYLHKIDKLYNTLLQKKITCVIAEEKLIDVLKLIDVPYGNFRFYTVTECKNAVYTENCASLKKAMVLIGKTSSNLNDTFFEGKDFLKVSLMELEI